MYGCDRRATPVKNKPIESPSGRSTEKFFERGTERDVARSAEKSAMCDDFDEDDEEESKSESKRWRDGGEDMKGSESGNSPVGTAFKRVPTMQRLEDMVAQRMSDMVPDDGYSSSDRRNCANSGNSGSRDKDRNTDRSNSNSNSNTNSTHVSPARDNKDHSKGHGSGSESSPKVGITESFFRNQSSQSSASTHSDSSGLSPTNSSNSRTMPAVSRGLLGSPRKSDEKDQDDRGRDRIPGIGKQHSSSYGSGNSSSSSNNVSGSNGSNGRDLSNSVTKLPSAVSSSAMFSPSKSSSSSNNNNNSGSSSSGSGGSGSSGSSMRGSNSTATPSMGVGSSSSGIKARFDICYLLLLELIGAIG